MEQERKVVSEQEAEELLGNYKRSGKFNTEELALIKADYIFGLSRQEIECYLYKKLSLGQMQAVSSSLRNHGDMEFAKILADAGVDEYQMKVAVEYRTKGVPVGTIKSALAETKSAYNMRAVLESLYKQMKEAEKATTAEGGATESIDKEYVDSIMAQMHELIGGITFDETRYQELEKRLKAISDHQKYEKDMAELYQCIADKDLLINSQQDNINQANSALARLRNEIAEKDKEMRKMQDTVNALNNEIGKKDETIRKIQEASEKEITNEKAIADKVPDIQLNELPNTAKIPGAPMSVMPTQYPNYFGIPVSYNMTLPSGSKIPPSYMQIEHTTKKSQGILALLGRLNFKKKSRQNIIKLIASGNLSTEQLMQIKVAIEKNLKEEQLLELINNNVPAEQMQEIIEIAVSINELEG